MGPRVQSVATALHHSRAAVGMEDKRECECERVQPTRGIGNLNLSNVSLPCLHQAPRLSVCLFCSAALPESVK